MEIKEMAITAQQVNDLRKKTGAGMMDCKNALTEANGDFEKAIEILRKKGAAVAAKRAEKSANEGLIVTKISSDRKHGSIAEINCETDFVAKSEDFINLTNNVIEAVFNNQPSSVEELYDKNPGIKAKVTEVVGKVGEKISEVIQEKALPFISLAIVMDRLLLLPLHHLRHRLMPLVTTRSLSSN